MKKDQLWSIAGVGVNTTGAMIVTPAPVRGLEPRSHWVYVLVMMISFHAGFLDLGLGWAAGRFSSQDLAGGNMTRTREGLGE